jgi:hypothetical protein
VRPELCHRYDQPRSAAGAGLYSPDMHILVLGDGDLSFSLALARQLGGGRPAGRRAGSLTATTHESFESLVRARARRRIQCESAGRGYGSFS